MKLFPALFLAACAALPRLQADDPLLPLPHLVETSRWETSGGLQAASVAGALEIVFDAAPGSTAELRLKQPVAIPEGADDLAVLLSASPQPCQFGFDVILADANGRPWYARTKLPGANEYHGAVGVVNTGQLKGKTVRLSLPALAQPGNARFFRDPGTGAPPRPWKWLGLRFLGDRQPHHVKEPVQLYLRGFALSANAARHSAYTGIRAELTGKPTAYAGGRVEFCTELDGEPGLSAFDFYRGPGSYQVSWELFADYAGRPVAGGRRDLTLAPGKDAAPLPLQLAQTLPYPRQKPGTYWVRWRAHYFPAGKDTTAPAQIVAGEERLYVHAAQTVAAATPVPALSPGWLDLRPRGESFVSATPATFGLRLEARRPAASAGGAEARLTVRTNHLRTVVKTATVPLEFGPDGAASSEIDLSALPPGPYKIEAELVADGAVQDRQVVLAGLRNAPGASAPLKALPAGVLDWKAALERKEPYFHLSPMWHSATWLMPDRTRWDWFKPFLDQAATVSRDIEYNTPWSILEPLPGVYDWEEMDRFLDRSREKGLQVLVWPGFWGEEPSWLPSVPTQAADGRIFFDFVYDFYGVRQDYASTPELQDKLLAALRSVVVHTRDHPAVQGYFLIQELPADAPFMNWMSGFGAREKAAYREGIKTRFATPAALSQRWSRPVARFDQLEPPGPQASAREWLDWLVFRAGTYDQFMGRLIQAVRKEDPLRPVFIYGDLFGTQLKSADFPTLGAAKANGGSHDAMHPFSISQIGQNGVLQRTEDHWPGKWTGYFEEVLDASVFAMSYGGGQAMNCKHYLFTYMPELGKDRPVSFDDLRKPPYSLDKFERFKPVWSALRPARRLPVGVVELLDTEAGLLENRALNRNGLWDGEAQLALYRSQVYFAADEFPGAAGSRLLLMIKSHLGTLTRERLGQIKDFVAGGGRLLMLAGAGRKSVEDAADDWVLLKELGFNAPSTPALVAGGGFGLPVEGQSFDPALERFALRGLWPHEPAAGETVVARASRQPAAPAVSWRPFGQGRVAVIWADKLVPRGLDGADGNLLKAAARWAGVADVQDSSTPAFWLNLLHDAGTGEYFGLVHAGQWQKKPDAPTAGTVRFKLDPAVRYRVTELITGRDLGPLTGAAVWEKGLETTLTPRQVAIFRFAPVR